MERETEREIARGRGKRREKRKGEERLDRAKARKITCKRTRQEEGFGAWV